MAPEMRLVALRGANSVKDNTGEAILGATDELMREILKRNGLGARRPRELHLHAHARPRRAVPGGRGARDGPVLRPLLCSREIPVPGALPKVIRVMIHAYLPVGTPPSTSTSATPSSCG